MDNNRIEGVSRRSILKGSGLSIAGVVGFTGAGAAAPGQEDGRTRERGRSRSSNGQTFETELKDGQLTLKKSTPAVEPTIQTQESKEFAEIDSNFHSIPNVERRAQRVIRELNAAAERGAVKFKEDEGGVRIIFTNSGGEN